LSSAESQVWSIENSNQESKAGTMQDYILGKFETVDAQTSASSSATAAFQPTIALSPPSDLRALAAWRDKKSLTQRREGAQSQKRNPAPSIKTSPTPCQLTNLQ
jgi:hypothetical protein